MTEDFDLDSLYEGLFDDTPDDSGGDAIGLTENQHASKLPPPSPTALHVDKWGMQRGRELAENAEFNVMGHDENTLADMHAACFEPNPILHENPNEKLRSRWMQDLLESPEYQSMKPNTAMDVGMSEIAGFSLANKFAEYASSLSEKERQDAETGGDGEDIGGFVKRSRSINKAIQEATEDVEQADDAMKGLGGDGGSDGQADPKEALKLFQRMKQDSTLQNIVNKMGRYRRLAQSLQRQKTKHGRDDVVGVELSGDIPRILPSELSMLGDAVMETDVMRRIIERQAMSRQHQGLESVSKGPIIVCVDESGSMYGEPHANAKAFAATMGWIAKSQNRWCGFVGFSGGCKGTRIAFPPHEWDTEKMIEWLTHFYSGGTTLDVPLKELPNVYWDELGCPRGKTDIILITDAIVHAPPEMVENFNRWKEQEQAKCYGIIIGSEPGDLEKVCDQTWSVDVFDVEQECVSEMLSI